MSYAYRRTVTIDHTKVGAADATDFPMLFSGTYTYLKTTGNGGKVANANGYDIAFFSDVAGTTQLAHEIESYNASTGAVTLWVKVPSVSHTADTVVYLFYGDAAVSTSQENVNGTWDSNFKLVNHLKDGTTLNLGDSTSNGNTGTNHSMHAVSGKADGSAEAQNDGEFYDAGTAAAIGITGAVTLECWVNATSLASTAAVMSRTGAVNNNIPAPYDLQINTAGKTVLVRGNGGVGGAGVSFQSHTATAGISTGSFFYVAVTMSASGASGVAATVTHYKNGAANGSGSISFSGAAADSGQKTQMGRRADGGIQLIGKLDEVRISNIARGADYFTATYNSINDPASFYTVGAQTQDLAGAAAVAFAAPGDVAVTRDLAGTSAITAGLAAATQIARDLAGAAAITVDATAAVAVARDLDGVTGLVFGDAGDVAVARDLAGTTGLAFGLGGLVASDLRGVAAAAFSATGAVTVTKGLAGSTGITAAADATITSLHDTNALSIRTVTKTMTSVATAAAPATSTQTATDG